ncbi:site-specific DNA-methyltransferase [Micrococcus yunnanensis]|uniref:site-specific DNA-methyltransferase n=1 Tax=Micrococcus yunnanensis TaxID=566027 RepID=UPI00398F19E3
MSEEVHETPSTTPNFQTELAAQIAELMPEVIADGKVDMEKLKELLDGDAADTSERFGLFWPGKKRALRAAQEPTTATLRPDFENSKDWDTTKNVFIEGDNLEVLKILQKHYHAKIKMIYIDPPYNTGKDFVYPDNYKEGLDTYLEWTRQVNEEGKKLSTNADTEGRYHSNWLNMMYPRLKLARNLLRADGAIMISIGDTELPHLLKVSDEVFGEANRVSIFAWKKRGTGGQVAKNAIIKQVEYVVLYARAVATVQLSGPKNQDEGKEGWRDFRKSGGQWQRQYRPGQYFPFYLHADGSLSLTEAPGATAIYPQDSNGVDGFWENGLETAMKRLAEGDFRAKEARQGLKIEQRDVAKATSNAGSFIEVPSTRGTEEIKSYFGDNVVFENPKPTEVLRALLTIGDVKNDDIVLDFFAGSGSTADAVMRMNADDDARRRVISVQLPEPVSDDSPAAAAGFVNISDLARARIKQAGEKIGEEITGQTVDVGFRAYRLTDTNFTKWKQSSDVDHNQLEQHLLELRDSSSADDASADDILTEILLKQGYSLTEQIAPVEVAGLDLRSVGDGVVLACLNEHVKPTLEQLRVVVDEDPARLIVLEDAFQGDDQLKTNLAQLCKSKGIELWTA